VSKADYPYADDEFDAPTGPDVPRGVHRAPRSAWSRWWPFLVVILVVPAIAYGLVTFASRDNSSSTPTSSTTSKAPSASASKPSTSPSAESSSEPSEPAESASEEPTAEVALATPVTVFNAAGISGLAASTVTDLKGAGFTNVTAANYVGTKPGESTVYYASDDLKATADLVAQTIGIDTVTLSESDAEDGVSAVLITQP